MTDQQMWHSNARRFGLFAYIGVAVSLLVCFWKAIVVVVGPLLGLSLFELNPHLQAVLMWVFAAVTLIALWRDQRRHGSRLPVSVGSVALLIIVGTLYGYYHVLILMSGYLVLVIAVFLNHNRMLVRLNAIVGQQAEQLTSLNRSLEGRVVQQVDEIERLARLKRFLPDEVAKLVTAEGNEDLLQSHRRYIACLYCDIRRFTAMTEVMEPEDLMEVIADYHARVGQLVAVHGGTIGYRAGDGVLVYFNDPIPCDDPDLRAVRLALDLRVAFEELTARWAKHEVDTGLGIGIASGYATMGVIGMEGRFDYTPIGSAVNLAARLSDQADDQQILVSRRTYAEVDSTVVAEPVGPLQLKGFAQPVEAFAVMRLRDDAAVVPMQGRESA